MAAKGTILKQEIIQKIVSTFPDSFACNGGKEIRINGQEEGNPVQIKITLTCAKTPIDNPNDESPTIQTTNFENAAIASEIIEPTEEEKAHLKTLLNELGLE